MIVSALVLAAALAVKPTPTPQAFLILSAPAATLSLEVADTQAKQERGLMYRTALPAHTGMIFIFDRDDTVEFWMKNTLIPLDMVFVSADGHVRSVSENVPSSNPDTPEDKVARVSGAAKYVLELPAREATADGLRPGAVLPRLAKPM